MKDFDKRIFTCENGHSYESKEPITTGWAEANWPQAPFPLSLFIKSPKQNNRCKICKAVIIQEDCYSNNKIVAGSIYAPGLVQ